MPLPPCCETLRSKQSPHAGDVWIRSRPPPWHSVTGKLRLLDCTPIEPIMAGANFKCCWDAEVGTGWIRCSRLELRSTSLLGASCNRVNRGVEGLLGCRSGPTMCCCAHCGLGLRQSRGLPTAGAVGPVSCWTFLACPGLNPASPTPESVQGLRLTRPSRGSVNRRPQYTDHS